MQKKKNGKGKDWFWKRLTKRQLRLLRGGDGDASSGSSGSGTSTTGGAVPAPPPAAPPARG